ncbi:hypothetical protein ACO1O0_005052 [Amphichorda felina]
MLPSSLFLLVWTAVAVASPLARRPDGHLGHRTTVPVLPVNGGERELPLPPTNTTLKALVLGFGIQNYTCTGPGAEPKATGALAMLYDISTLYPDQCRSSLDLDAFNALTSDAIWGLEVPLNLVLDIDIDIGTSSPSSRRRRLLPRGANPQHPFPPPSPLDLPQQEDIDPLPYAGQHFFNADGAPQFRLRGSSGASSIDLIASKLGQVDAPADADAGPDRTGAVPWLQLGSSSAGSVGAKFVYRVMTTGGVSHGCLSAGEDSSAYTAQYWFYG